MGYLGLDRLAHKMKGGNNWKAFPKPFYVKHNNKAGGTSLCAATKEAGVRVPRLYNCNGDKEFARCVHEEKVSVSKGQITCKRAATRCNSSYRVIFNEGTLFHWRPEQYNYITTIRDPLSRVVSQMLHHWQNQLPFDPKNGELVNASDMLQLYVKKIPLRGKGSIYNRAMQTKSIASGSRNLTEAKNRLRQFSLVIPTEKMSKGIIHYMKLLQPFRAERKRGRRLIDFLQTNLLLDSSAPRPRNVRNAKTQLMTISIQDPALLQRLQAAEWEDIELHRFARALFKEQH